MNLGGKPTVLNLNVFSIKILFTYFLYGLIGKHLVLQLKGDERLLSKYLHSTCPLVLEVKKNKLIEMSCP